MSLEFTSDLLSGDLSAVGHKGRYEIIKGEVATLSIRMENPAGASTDSFSVFLSVEAAINAANLYDTGEL